MPFLSYSQQLHRLMNQMIRISRKHQAKMNNGPNITQLSVTRHQFLTNQDANYTKWLVSDLAKSGIWLQQMLGFTVQHRITSAWGCWQGVSLRKDEIYLDLYESPNDVYQLPLESSFTNELTVVVPDLNRIIGLLHIKGESLTAGPFVDYQHRIRYGYIQIHGAHFIKLIERLPPT